MELSPEERRKIYEEEKEQIEAEQSRKTASDDTSTGLMPNVAGLFCYLGAWITGIIFVVIEQKNHFVRFHAVQSILVFGTLTVASALLSWIPYIGGFFGAVIGILGFVLWIVLMVKAYQGELYKVPLAGDIAGNIIPQSAQAVEAVGDSVTSDATASSNSEPLENRRETGSEIKTARPSMDRYFAESRTMRITSSSFVIAWCTALVIFFSFFYSYIAYYHQETVNNITTWTRTPLLTDDYFIWLPIVITALILSIAGHIILIIHDRYWLRQTVLIILNIAGIITVASLVVIFPFDFDVITSGTWSDVIPVILTIALVCVAVGIGIGALVMLIKLVVNLVKEAGA